MKKTFSAMASNYFSLKTLGTQFFLIGLISLNSVHATAQEVQTPMANHAINTIQLSSNASVSVAQDLLKISLSTTKEGVEAGQVQEQLKKAVDEALKQLKTNASSSTYSVQTGNFSLNPRYSNQGKLNGWQGSAEISIEGKDFGAIANSAGSVKTMVISTTVFSLSEEKRLEASAKAQSIAIERFKQRSVGIAKSFGFTDYTIKNVAITDSGSEHEPVFAARSKNMVFAMADSAPVPVQAGSSEVLVRVNGSILLK